MIHASLCSGQGACDLAAEWMGWNNIFHREINPFGQKVLKHYWPNATSYTDIKTTDFSIHRGTIDIISGGFPCQPYSQAGKRLGKEDDRHLWPEMLRAIREISPRWIVGENVRGLTNWNGGVVFDEVQADLEFAGYEVTPFLLPAVAVNAPHRRDRIWFVAYSNSDVYPPRLDDGGNRRTETGGEDESQQSRRWDKNRQRIRSEPGTSCEDVTYPQRVGQQRSGRAVKPLRSTAFGNGKASWSNDDGGWPTQPAVCFGDNGLPTNLDRTSVSDWREESIKAAGNAIVPQVVFQIFKSIEAYENITS